MMANYHKHAASRGPSVKAEVLVNADMLATCGKSDINCVMFIDSLILQVTM